MNRRIVGAVAGILVSLAILALPSVGALDALGQRALAFIALGVVFWATDVLSAGITALLVLGLMLATGLPAADVLKGFSVSAFWILVSVLFFGHAMDKTGLARRIAYRILLVFPGTYAGILLAFLCIGSVLALGIPSMTVRTAIIMPIAWALVQALNLELPSRGSALIILSTFEMAVLPGCAILTGALWGPHLIGLFGAQNLELTWLGYAAVMFIPTLLWCLLVLAGNMLVLRPSGTLGVTGDIARSELERLGGMSRSEVMTASVVGLSVLAWASQPWHKIPPEAIGMLALSALFATQVLAPAEISTGISWPLALFVGGVLSVSNVMTKYKINDWLSSFIIPAVDPVVGNALLLALVLGVGVMAMRFIDPVGFISITAFFPPLAKVAPSWGVSPLVLAGIIVLPLHVFWFSYQNIWIVITDGVTKKQAYTDGDRVKLAHVYAVTTLIGIAMAVGYWKLTGAL